MTQIAVCKKTCQNYNIWEQQINTALFKKLKEYYVQGMLALNSIHNILSVVLYSEKYKLSVQNFTFPVVICGCTT
jgi:hypothetical protein